MKKSVGVVNKKLSRPEHFLTNFASNINQIFFCLALIWSTTAALRSYYMDVKNNRKVTFCVKPVLKYVGCVHDK